VAVTQLQRALKAWDENDLDALQDVIAQAQNQPPLGEADGSICESTWYVLRDAHRIAREYISCVEILGSPKHRK
jgi:hypothetical protein